MCFYILQKTEYGHQKWRRNDFLEECTEAKSTTIVLSHTISDINVFLHFMQKFKMAAKNGGTTIIGKRELGFIYIGFYNIVSYYDKLHEIINIKLSTLKMNGGFAFVIIGD